MRVCPRDETVYPFQATIYNRAKAGDLQVVFLWALGEPTLVR